MFDRENLTSYFVTVGVFGAAGVMGGLLKIPSPVGSIALDSLAGYFAAAYFGPKTGGPVGAIGHVGSAAIVGFPLGGWIHANVALHMFVWCAVFGYIIRKIDRQWALYPAGAVAIILNGIATPYLLVPAGLTMNTATGLVGFLVLASALNVVIASIAVKTLSALNVRI